MAKAKAAPNFTVKVVVWVMNPGPMADVAMRNIAPSTVARVLSFMDDVTGRTSALPVVEPGGGVPPGSAGGCDMDRTLGVVEQCDKSESSRSEIRPSMESGVGA